MNHITHRQGTVQTKNNLDQIFKRKLFLAEDIMEGRRESLEQFTRIKEGAENQIRVGEDKKSNRKVSLMRI